MIRTTKLSRLSLGLGHYRRCMMTADVIESTQNVIVTAHGNNGFSGDFAGDVLTWLRKPLRKSNHLPGSRKDGLELEAVKALIDVPRSRNRCRLVERRVWIVVIDEFAEGPGHRVGRVSHRLHSAA